MKNNLVAELTRLTETSTETALMGNGLSIKSDVLGLAVEVRKSGTTGIEFSGVLQNGTSLPYRADKTNNTGYIDEVVEGCADIIRNNMNKLEEELTSYLNKSGYKK